MGNNSELPRTQSNLSEAVPDAFDYKGRPAERSKGGGWITAFMALVTEANERLTTLGIGVNLVTYLTGVMHLGQAASANIVTNFMGTSFMLSLVGGFLADTYLGRYLTIAIFVAVQGCGVLILTISVIVPTLRPPACTDNKPCIVASGSQMAVLYIALFTTALGTGGLKSSVSGFGSDQFDDTHKGEAAQMRAFFNWFFFFITFGSLAAVTILVYIQDNIGRQWGYGICCGCIFLGLTVFLLGTKRYRFKKLGGSPLSQIAAVISAAWKKRKLDTPEFDQVFTLDCVAPEAKRGKEKLPRSKQFKFLDKASIKDPGMPPVVSKYDHWTINTVTDVEEVKLIFRMLPIWATTIMFWTVYAQMSTFSVSQATTLDRHIGSSFQLPAGSLTLFFVSSILITVPIYDRLIVPIFRRLLNNPNGLTPLQRIGVGLILSAMSMAAAALVEIKRLHLARKNPLLMKDAHAAILPMRVFWLIPQQFLVGSGVAFTYIGQLNFFLRECPKGMKTISTALFLTTLALGFYFSTLCVFAVKACTAKNPWLADNLNRGKLYNFYWLLGGLSMINFIVFLVFARWYMYKEKWLAAEGYLQIEEDNPKAKASSR